MTFCPDIEPYNPSLADKIKFWRRRIPQLLRFHFHHYITHPVKRLLWRRGYIYKDYDLILHVPGLMDGIWIHKDAINNVISANDIVSSQPYTTIIDEALPWKYEHKEQ